jgi:hypothetical protein
MKQRDPSLQTPHDIRDLAGLGKASSAPPEFEIFWDGFEDELPKLAGDMPGFVTSFREKAGIPANPLANMKKNFSGPLPKMTGGLIQPGGRPAKGPKYPMGQELRDTLLQRGKDASTSATGYREARSANVSTPGAGGIIRAGGSSTGAPALRAGSPALSSLLTASGDRKSRMAAGYDEAAASVPAQIKK